MSSKLPPMPNLQRTTSYDPCHPIATDAALQTRLYTGCVHVKARGYRCIVVAKEWTTGYPEARMLKRINMRAVAEFIYEYIICCYGAT
jgi:hypothetical protein